MVAAHPADLLNLRFRDRLLVSYYGEGLQEGIRQHVLAGRLCNLNQIFVHFRLCTHLEGILQLHQRDPAFPAFVFLSHLHQQLAGDLLAFFNYSCKPLHLNRLSHGEKNGLQYSFFLLPVQCFPPGILRKYVYGHL